MNRRTLTPLVGLLAVAAPTLAQDVAPAAPAAPVSPVAALAQAAREEPWMSKTIDLELKDVTPIEAIKKVLEAAGITDYKIADGIEKSAADIKLGLAFKQVKVGEALRTVCRIAGAAYIPSTKDGKPSVNVVRRSDPVNLITNFAPAQIARNTNWVTTTRPALTLRSSGMALPEKRVSIDVRRKSVRDTLKDVLKQADLDFVIEDGIADDLKRSFTFENVPIGTALDAICRSAEVGWTVERKGDKPLVRIGKDIKSNRSSPFSTFRTLSPNGETIDLFEGFTDLPAISFSGVPGLADSLPLMLEGLSHFPSLEGAEIPKEARAELERALKESRREIERAMKDQRSAIAKARAESKAADKRAKAKSDKSDKPERPPFEP